MTNAFITFLLDKPLSKNYDNLFKHLSATHIGGNGSKKKLTSRERSNRRLRTQRRSRTQRSRTQRPRTQRRSRTQSFKRNKPKQIYIKDMANGKKPEEILDLLDKHLKQIEELKKKETDTSPLSWKISKEKKDILTEIRQRIKDKQLTT